MPLYSLLGNIPDHTSPEGLEGVFIPEFQLRNFSVLGVSIFADVCGQRYSGLIGNAVQISTQNIATSANSLRPSRECSVEVSRDLAKAEKQHTL